jgi:hypothetical protein
VPPQQQNSHLNFSTPKESAPTAVSTSLAGKSPKNSSTPNKSTPTAVLATSAEESTTTATKAMVENKPAHASATSNESTATTQLVNNTKDSCILALEEAWTSFHGNSNSSTESDMIVTKKVCEPGNFSNL